MLNEVDQGGNSAHVPALNGIPSATIRAELDRILRSRVFVHSHRIRRFLQFVVEECLQGQQHRLKEYLIGLEVFNRLEAFDPRVDSIVRVEARRLRAKLDEYYQSEGRDSEVRIELRKGSYIPMFEPRRAGSNGYSNGTPNTHRNSITIAEFGAPDSGYNERVLALRRTLAHILISDGYCRVFTDQHRESADGSGDGAIHKADYLLRGNLEPGEDNFKVLLQLQSSEDGSYVWSGAGEAHEIESLGRSLNRAVAVSTGMAEMGRLKRHRGQNRSFDPYLQGRYLWKLGTPEAIRSSAAFFSKAVERDPAYAAAWAALSESLIVSSIFCLSNPREVNPKIRETAQKAVELNPGLPEAHVALGAVRSVLDCNWNAGETEFLQAVQLDGRDPSVHVAYAMQLMSRGMRAPAMAEVERAIELDPASLAANFALGWFHGVAGRYDEAIARHGLVSELAPDFPLAYMGLGWAHAGKGLYGDAIAHFTNAANLLKSRPLLAGCLGFCYARLDQKDEAMRQLAVLTHNQPGQYAPAVSIAAIYSGLGDRDRAFEALNQAADAGDLSLPLQLLNPEFEPLHSDPRYLKLTARMGLAQEPAAN